MVLSFPEFTQQTAKITQGCLLILMGATAYFTWRGADMVLGADGGGVMDRSAAMVYALGVSSMTYLFWRYAMAIMPALTSRRSWFVGIAGVLAGCGMIVGFSSWLNIVALAGAEAHKIAFRETAGLYEATVDGYAEPQGTAAALRGSLVQAQEELLDWAEREAAQGALSGFAGTGAVHDSLMTAARQIAGTIRMLDEGLARSESLIEQARGNLATLRGIAEASEPVATRRQLFAAEAGRLVATLAAIENLRLAEALARDLERLAGTAAATAPSSQAADVAAAQSSAIGTVEWLLVGITEPLAGAAREMAMLPYPDMPQAEPLSTVRAVWVHAPDLLPYWAGGIGLDLMPLLLIMMMSVLRSALHPAPDIERANGDLMSAAEIRRALRALDGLTNRPRGDVVPIQSAKKSSSRS